MSHTSEQHPGSLAQTQVSMAVVAHPGRVPGRQQSPLQMPQPEYPTPDGEVIAPASRNAPCPCGSGRKYKHCHGAVA